MDQAEDTLTQHEAHPWMVQVTVAQVERFYDFLRLPLQYSYSTTLPVSYFLGGRVDGRGRGGCGLVGGESAAVAGLQWR